MPTLKIKNIVCPRCIRVVREELSAAGYPPEAVGMGTATYAAYPDEEGLRRIAEVLEENGFALLLDAEDQKVEQIKTLIINHIHDRSRKQEAENLSDYLSRELRQNYGALSKLFSSHEGQTIERFLIRQKIERAKEVLSYGEENLAEIAFDLDYSSTAHLSGQFKRETGMTTTQFRKLKAPDRLSLDDLGEAE
jgi:AraC-like DNA-binding protein